ncbi:MAG TPA: hypothetical protein VKT82_03815 [Ktedonobacterales bacterium]|nr:hypothetical protein [Ktedonobacterales bacterium]
MSKRSLNVLVGILILVLIVGIIAYFVSAGFQGWVQTWLGNPVGLAASATTVAALATLLAVVVGLRGIYVGRKLAHEAFEQTEKAQAEGRQQFLEAQYNARRPLLVPAAADLSEVRELEEPIAIEWNTSVFVTIRNVGTGIATNIRMVVLPPAPAPEDMYPYVFRLGTPLPADSDPVKVYLRPGAVQYRESERLHGHSLYLPPERVADPADNADHFLARLCITYQDVFGRKHASIFDLSDWGIWVNVAFLTNIERDLAEIGVA